MISEGIYKILCELFLLLWLGENTPLGFIYPLMV